MFTTRFSARSENTDMREAARLSDLLDEALRETFPASDPVAITVRDPPVEGIKALNMKVAVIGSGGRVGSRLVKELLRRGHTVTAIERHPKAQSDVKSVQADATRPAELAAALVENDAVISATRFVSSDADVLIAAVTMAGIKRLLVVGGAATLEVAPGKALLDSPGFPDAYRQEAMAGKRFLDALRRAASLDWTFLSPSAEFAPGERTGKFRTGGDALLTDASGKSWISMEDFAIALVDELERPRHRRQRFTVGY